MKILICALNTKYVHSSLAPWYLKSACDGVNAEAEVYESTINEDREKILCEILQKNFEIIGFSTYIWNVEEVLYLCERIRKEKEVKIVLGGPEVSYCAEKILCENPCVDYVISGEGEIPISKLVSGHPVCEIEGLSYRENGDIRVKEPYYMNEDPPSPYTEEFFENSKKRIVYIESSRGCPYRCAFCLSGRCGTVRFFDIEKTKKEMISLAQSGSKTIKFVDRTFNADKTRAKEILRFINDNYGTLIPDGTCYHFEIEADILDDEIIEILSNAKSGSVQIEIGIQSFNQKTLDAINRKTNMQRLCENVHKLVKSGNIHIHTDLIIGLPYEDMKSFEDSFNKAVKLGSNMLQIGFLKLLHGADMREKPEKYPLTYSKKPPYEVISTPWMSEDEIKNLHVLEDAYDRLCNSGRFAKTVEYIEQNSENPFKTYTSFAFYMKENEKEKSLDGFTRCVLGYFSENGYNAEILRDKLAYDRLSSNRMGYLPEFLRVHSPKIKQILNMLEKNPETAKKEGIKRSATILPTEQNLIYVDYISPNPVTSRYTVHTVSLNCINEKEKL